MSDFIVALSWLQATLLRNLHPLKPDSAWSSSVWVFGIGPLRWNELQNVR